MKFIYTAAGMVEETNPFMDKVNKFSDWAIQKEVELVFAPLWAFIKEAGIMFGHWFIINLPDITGYATMAAGIAVILSSMIGENLMMKALGFYAAFLITALCILGGVK